MNTYARIISDPVFIGFGLQLLSIADQYQFEPGDFVECEPGRTHGNRRSVVTPHGIDCDYCLYHSGCPK
jgi:hypothetical protein